MKKYFTRVLILSLILVLGLTLGIAYAQGELGATGLADPPTDGMPTQYMFTGVYNKITDPESVTVVHCTNVGPSAANVTVEFFTPVPSYPGSATRSIAPSNTQSFATQAVAGWSNLAVPGTELNILYGSGRVRATDGSQIICTVQKLALDSNDVPVDMSKLHLFDASGNLINGPSSGTGSSGDIFLPLIFKN